MKECMKNFYVVLALFAALFSGVVSAAEKKNNKLNNKLVVTQPVNFGKDSKTAQQLEEERQKKAQTIIKATTKISRTGEGNTSRHLTLTGSAANRSSETAQQNVIKRAHKVEIENRKKQIEQKGAEEALAKQNQIVNDNWLKEQQTNTANKIRGNDEELDKKTAAVKEETAAVIQALYAQITAANKSKDEQIVNLQKNTEMANQDLQRKLESNTQKAVEQKLSFAQQINEAQREIAARRLSIERLEEESLLTTIQPTQGRQSRAVTKGSSDTTKPRSKSVGQSATTKPRSKSVGTGEKKK